MIGELLVSVTAAAAVAVVLGAGVMLLARRSARWAAVVAPLVGVLAILAGIVVGTQQMLIADDARNKLLAIVLAAAPVALASGWAVARRVAALTERAERERAEDERRRELERTRLELISWLSHDLRTPLAGIRAMSEALEDGLAPDPGAYLRAIGAEAVRTTEMVNDMLTLSRLHAGADLARVPVDLREVVEDVAAIAAPLAAAREMRVLTRADGNEPLVTGDPRFLLRLAQNLVVNAIQYGHPGTEVIVATATTGQTAVLTVRDSCGAGASGFARRFETGWRADAARTPETRSGTAGAGLGLAIVSSVVDAHGGTVGVRATPGGCEVRVELPRRAG